MEYELNYLEMKIRLKKKLKKLHLTNFNCTFKRDFTCALSIYYCSHTFKEKLEFNLSHQITFFI